MHPTNKKEAPPCESASFGYSGQALELDAEVGVYLETFPVEGMGDVGTACGIQGGHRRIHEHSAVEVVSERIVAPLKAPAYVIVELPVESQVGNLLGDIDV